MRKSVKKSVAAVTRPLLMPLSRYPEFCKAILLVAFGYCFCFLFLMDYADPLMNIFYRWSTTSQTALRHPVLFAIYALLLAFSFFFNLDYTRRRYNCGSKTVAVLQYIGLVGMLLVLFVKTSHTNMIMYQIHHKSTIVFAVGNAFSLFLFIALQMRHNRRFRPWFIGGVMFVLVVIPAFILRLSGFVETVPILIAMVALYIINYTNILNPSQEEA